MEKKNNNGMLVGLLIGIIIMLLVFIGLFATGVINFKENIENSKQEIKNEIDEDNTKEKTENQESEYQIEYEEEEYITKRKDGTEVSKSIRNLPKITNNKNQEAADKITKYLTEISNKEWENDIKKMADQVTELPYDGLGVKYLFATGVVTNNRLTFLLNMNGTFGGVTWLSNEGFNFDAKTGEILTTDTIAENKEKLKQYMMGKTTEKIEELKASGDSCMNDNYKEKLEEEINRSGNWCFTASGVIIKLQKYSVACGAAGIIEINLPKEEINQYLKDNYKI